MSEQYKGDILIVDDVPENLHLLKDILANDGYQVRPAPNGKLALREAENLPPDLIMLDISMPEMSGYEVCEKLKENPLLESIPVIFISALNEVSNKVHAFDMGAVDYVTKPFEPKEVLARIDVHIRLRKALNEIEEKNAQLEHLAMTDVLTNVPNRRYLLDTLQKTVLLAQRHSYPLCIMMVDIDKFKLTNDTFGHQIGDQVLTRTAQTINEVLRESDFIGRYGGEEFLILFPHTSLQTVSVVCERIRKSVEDIQWRNKILRVTISGGVAELKPNDKVADLIKRADSLLYSAKENGRNQIQF